MTSREFSRFADAMANSQLGLWDWNLQTGETIFNERWADIVGYTLEELSPTTIDTWVELAHPDDLENSNAAIQEHLAGNSPFYDVRARMKHRDGHWVWVHDRGRVSEWDHEGNPLRMVGTHEDITSQVYYEDELRWAVSIFERAPEGLARLNEDCQVEKANPALARLLGASESTLIGMPIEQVLQIQDSHEANRVCLEGSSSEGMRLEQTITRPDGTAVPLRITINGVRSPQDVLTGFIVVASDMSAQREAEIARVTRQIDLDPATGLMNRRGLLKWLHKEAKQSSMDGFTGLAVVALDEARKVLEVFGYQAADELLQHIARPLSLQATGSVVVALVDPTHFAIVSSNFTSKKGLANFAEAIHAHVRGNYVLPDGKSFWVEGWTGYTEQDPYEEPELALQQAIAASRVASEEATSGVRIYTADIGETTSERIIRTVNLIDAWESREFHLAYQPQFSVADSSLTGLEALMRWDSPTLGPISPEVFIPLVEESGLAVEVTEWVIREACRQGVLIIESGVSDFVMSVNVSALAFYEERFVERVLMALSDTGFPPDQLMLELTESAIFSDTRQTVSTLQTLQDQGIEIAIDDFGTGYSSFAYLRRFDVNQLKIDRTFLRGFEGDIQAHSIVESIVNLAHNLGMQALAEGVETHAQLETLRSMGCDQFQGFLMSKALDPDTLMQFLERHR